MRIPAVVAAHELLRDEWDDYKNFFSWSNEAGAPEMVCGRVVQ